MSTFTDEQIDSIRDAIDLLPLQHLRNLKHLERIAEVMDNPESCVTVITITESLDSISNKLGVIANALLQLSDRHGSKTPGPF